MKPVNVGLVGCGVALRHHMLALKSVPRIRVLWFCDKNERSAREARQLWGRDALVRQQFDTCVKENKTDVVHICTPPATHAELAVKALEAGCHVLLEKPMATSTEEGLRILEARDRSGRMLCMMHNHIFDPTILSIRRAVEEGAFGDLTYGVGRHFVDVRKMFQEKFDRPDHWAFLLKSGIAGEHMPHTIYLLESFLGPCQELELIFQERGRDCQISRMKESFALQLRFEKAVGHILMLTCMEYGHFNLDLYGTKAAVHVNMMDLTSSIERIPQHLPKAAAHMASTLDQSLQRMWMTLANAMRIATGRLKRRPGHRLLIKKFYKAVRTGEAVPVPGEDGLATVRTIEQLDRAIASLEK